VKDKVVDLVISVEEADPIRTESGVLAQFRRHPMHGSFDAFHVFIRPAAGALRHQFGLSRRHL